MGAMIEDLRRLFRRPAEQPERLLAPNSFEPRVYYEDATVHFSEFRRALASGDVLTFDRCTIYDVPDAYVSERSMAVLMDSLGAKNVEMRQCNITNDRLPELQKQ